MEKSNFRASLIRARRGLALWAGTSLRMAWSTIALWLVAIALMPITVAAHPLHSEAIERPCVIHHRGDAVSSIKGRCAFFIATGYLVFQLDAAAEDGSAQSAVVSGAINLSQSTGSIFRAGEGQLANGTLTVADSSSQVVHMKPGVLAAWENGYVLEVSGNPARTEDTIESAVPVNSEPVAKVFANYLRVGFLHIIPLGFDHILFIIGLFLLSPNLRTLLWQVSAFTLAHTVTLALGATGVVQLPATIVEPLIALSIVWIAIENLLTNKHQRWRIGVIFCFGLLHGLGFAGVLKEIGFIGSQFVASLLAFNIGVELGQLAVIALCFTAFGWMTGRPLYQGRVVVPVSSLIALIGAYWLVERIDFF